MSAFEARGTEASQSLASPLIAKRIRLWIAAGGALLTMACAANADIVMIDANNYASGTNVTNAGQGVTFSWWNVPGPGNGPATLSPMYAVTDPNCPSGSTSAMCFAVSGTNVFFQSPSAPAGSSTNLGSVNIHAAVDYMSSGGTDFIGGFTAIRVDFTSPTDFFDLVGSTGDGIPADQTQLLAFNAAGALVGFCGAPYDVVSLTPVGVKNGCSTVLAYALNSPSSLRYVNYDLQIAASGISTIVYGQSFGGAGGASVTSFAYDASPVPLPGAAWLLASALGGLGMFTTRRRSAE
jgi:hypothetical protein